MKDRKYTMVLRYMPKFKNDLVRTKVNENIGLLIELPPLIRNFSQTLTYMDSMKEKDKRRLQRVAANLTKIRESKGLSIRQLAARCDVDHAKISKIEGNKANLMVTTLIELAEGLGVHPKKMFEFDNDE